MSAFCCFFCVSQSLFSCVSFLSFTLSSNVFNAVNLGSLSLPVYNHQSHSIFMNFLSPPWNNMSHKLKILSLDVRGLRNTHKRGAIFSYLKKQKATIFNLQETFSKPEDEKIWTAEWGGKVFSPMARITRRESQSWSIQYRCLKYPL